MSNIGQRTTVQNAMQRRGNKPRFFSVKIEIMRMSRTAVKLTKIPPKDADTINHKLLVQAGFVRQLMAGVYTYLPWGLNISII